MVTGRSIKSQILITLKLKHTNAHTCQQAPSTSISIARTWITSSQYYSEHLQMMTLANHIFWNTWPLVGRRITQCETHLCRCSKEVWILIWMLGQAVTSPCIPLVLRTFRIIVIYFPSIAIWLSFQRCTTKTSDKRVIDWSSRIGMIQNPPWK